MNIESSYQTIEKNRTMKNYHPTLNISNTLNPKTLQDSITISQSGNTFQSGMHNQYISSSNPMNLNHHHKKSAINFNRYSFDNQKDTPSHLPLITDCYAPRDSIQTINAFQTINYGVQPHFQYSQPIITDQKHHQIYNPSQIIPQYHMILMNPLNYGYPLANNSQQDGGWQNYMTQAPENISDQCYLRYVQQQKSNQANQLIHQSRLDDESCNLQICKQVQGAECQQKMNSQDSQKKTQNMIKTEKDDTQEPIHVNYQKSFDSKCQQKNKLPIQKDLKENFHQKDYLKVNIKNENKQESNLSKNQKIENPSQKNEELQTTEQCKVRDEIQLEKSGQKDCHKFKIDKTKQPEFLLSLNQQPDLTDLSFKKGQKELYKEPQLYQQIQTSEKQQCGYRKRHINDELIEIQSAINSSFIIQSRDIYQSSINSSSSHEILVDESEQADYREREDQQVHQKETYASQGQLITLLEKRRLYQLKDEKQESKQNCQFRLNKNQESLTYNSIKNLTLKNQLGQKQIVNFNDPSVTKKQKIQNENPKNKSKNSQDEITSEQIFIDRSNSASLLSNDLAFQPQKQQLLNMKNEKTYFKNKYIKLEQKQLQKNELLKSNEIDCNIFAQYDMEEEWEDSFFHHIKQNSRSGGKSFFLVSNYKKKLFKQLDPNDQSVIVEMKKSKKFNFSKNVIKQFLKVMSFQINYIYLLNENLNSKEEFQKSQQARFSIGDQGFQQLDDDNNIKNCALRINEKDHLNIDSQISFKNACLLGKKSKEKLKKDQSNLSNQRIEDKFDASNYVQIKNPSQSLLNELRQKIKQFLISSSYTHLSLKKIISHKYYSLYFRDFLENYSEEWIQSGKTKYKNEQQIMIHFLKLCFSNRKLLIFLSQHDPLKCKENNENQ